MIVTASYLSKTNLGAHTWCMGKREPSVAWVRPCQYSVQAAPSDQQAA